MEWITQCERTVNWNREDVVLPGFVSTSWVVVDKYKLESKRLHDTFLSEQMTKDDILQAEELIGLSVEKVGTQLCKLKYVIGKSVYYAANVDVSVRGQDDELWFGRIDYLFGYFVGTVLQQVFFKINWYKCFEPVLENSIMQFTLLKVKHENITSIVKLEVMLGMVYRSASFYSDRIRYPFLIDTCYFVKKNYNEEEDIV
jgi:hypothetical protein